MNEASSTGPEPGTEFAGHRVEAVIGAGGMGVVYRARNLALDRERALKVLAPALSRDARFRERFRRESRLAASIEHPNVIPVHEAGERDGHLYISMRLVEGRDLRRVVAEDGPLDPSAAVAVIAAVAAGLDAAHAARLIHRDVKPANVLVGSGADAGRVFLTDFGISRTTRGGDTVTGTGELVGTADYVSPEQIAGDPVDGRSDVYSLGAVLYFAVTGRPPFERDSEVATLFAHTNARRPRASDARPDLPPAVDAVLARAMAIDPGERFETAGSMARALADAFEGRATEPMPRAATGPARRRVWPGALVAGALVAATVVAVVLAGGGGDDRTPPDETPPPAAAPAIQVGRSPTGVAVGSERVWVAARGGGQVDAIDLITSQRTFDVEVPAPSSVAVGFGSVWAVSGAANALFRLDPLEGADPVAVPLGEGADPSDVAVDGRWVWVVNEGSSEVVRIDPQTNEPAGFVRVGLEPRAVATGDGAVWVTNVGSASVSEIDPDVPQRTGNAIPVSELPNDIAVGEGSVWVTSNLNGTVTQIDPRAGRVVGDPIAVGTRPRAVKAGLGHVWVALGGDDAVVRVDPATGEVAGQPIPVGDDPADIALGTDSVWTANEGDSTVSRIEP